MALFLPPSRMQGPDLSLDGFMFHFQELGKASDPLIVTSGRIVPSVNEQLVDTCGIFEGDVFEDIGIEWMHKFGLG